MLTIEYVIGGRRITPETAESGLEAALLTRMNRRIEKILEGWHCPWHHQLPRVTLVGAAIESLRIEVGGCCKPYVDEVREVLEQEQVLL
jgi:hypothetical protein